MDLSQFTTGAILAVLEDPIVGGTREEKAQNEAFRQKLREELERRDRAYWDLWASWDLCW